MERQVRAQYTADYKAQAVSLAQTLGAAKAARKLGIPVETLATSVFVAYPAGFDFMFVYWYLMKFVGESPFSHSALDIKSFAMAVLKKNYRVSTKRNRPKRWFDELPHTHVALSDAIEQGALFCNMLKQSRA